MRVIAGKFKGRTLVAVGDNTRPTLDRTKETLFNILQMRIAGATVLDLFAGSGQLAIECLSRGANRAILCDNDKSAQKAIKLNFEKISQVPELFCGNYDGCLRSISPQSLDIIFVDPPYKSNYYLDVLSKIDCLNLLAQDGIVVCEHGFEDALPDSVGCLTAFDKRKIGSVQFTFYRRLT